MQDYNKKNLLFLAVVFAAAITVFFAVVMLTYLAEARGLWSAPIPVVAVGYGIYAFLKKYLPHNDKEGK